MPDSTLTGDELQLLAGALDLETTRLRPRSREPLGAGSVAGFDVVSADDASATGSPLLYFVDTSGYAVTSETGLALRDPSRRAARVWLHPADPHLPALAAVAFGRAAQTMLGRLGLAAVAPPAFVAYRPGRRAVVHVETTTGGVWIKVVRPARVRRIVDVHERLAAAGIPLPTLRGWSPEGLIVLDRARGTPATESDWTPDRLLDELEELRASFARVPLAVRNHSVGTRLDWYADRLATASVVDADVVVRLRVDLELLLAQSSARPARTVHGDLHIGQLFLDPSGGLSGVVDVDTSGAGSVAEDEAAFLSHAIASALVSALPSDRQRAWSLADHAYERWGQDAATRALAAVHLLGHSLAAADLGENARAETLIDTARAIVDRSAPSSMQTRKADTNAESENGLIVRLGAP